MTAQVYVFQQDRLRPLELRAGRPLRWAAWQPDGSWCLLAGNGGTALRYNGGAVEAIETGTKRNLRGAAFSPDGSRALLAGNQGEVLLLEDGSVRRLRSGATANLRRVAWRPQGDAALIAGNEGTVLRCEPDGRIEPVPGDRAHTLRAIAWRPDGSYALVGAYASGYAGYPRPHALYRCDGRYLQALLATDDEDDFTAVDWRPGGNVALIAGYAYSGSRASAKVLLYDGRGFTTQLLDAPGALLGGAWHPGGAYALLCGEGGTLLRYTPEGVEPIESGTRDNLVGPFWHPDGSLALLLKGPSERVYTA